MLAHNEKLTSYFNTDTLQQLASQVYDVIMQARQFVSTQYTTFCMKYLHVIRDSTIVLVFFHNFSRSIKFPNFSRLLRTQSDAHITIYFISRYDAIKNPTADLATHLETGTHKNMKSAKTAVTGAPKFDLRLNISALISISG
jgi:hypothetical protein